MLFVPGLAVLRFNPAEGRDVRVQGGERVEVLVRTRVREDDTSGLGIVEGCERGEVLDAASMLPEPRETHDGRPSGPSVFEAGATGTRADVRHYLGRDAQVAPVLGEFSRV